MNLKLSESFQKDLMFLGGILLFIVLAAGASNLMTSDDPVRVGMVEIETYCAGIDAGVCLGLERKKHVTYNYDNYEDAEPGTPNYYRKVESELMARAYNTCSEDVTGMEWASEVEYDGQTAEEWLQNDNIQLLPCEQTFYRNLTANP